MKLDWEKSLETTRETQKDVYEQKNNKCVHNAFVRVERKRHLGEQVRLYLKWRVHSNEIFSMLSLSVARAPYDVCTPVKC